MPRSIFIIGAQCTGKTTLLNALTTSPLMLALSDATPIVIPEVAGRIMIDEGFSSKDFSTSRWNDLQKLILRAQYREEDKLRNSWFLSDRSALDPIVYTKLNNGDITSLISQHEWQVCRQTMRDSLVILCEAGNQTWLSSDDIRLDHRSPTEWTAITSVFQELLDAERIPYHLLPAKTIAIAERVAFVEERVMADPHLETSQSKQ